MASYIERRKFLATLGGAAAWPLAARAQTPARIRRIGILSAFAEDDPEARGNVAVFRQALENLGWTDGGNARIDYRWGGADAARIRAYALELLSLKPDVFLVSTALVLQPLQQLTRDIPIVFTQISDPVGSGFIASLAHPGGNVTGFTPAEFSMYGKALEVLKEIAPHVTCVAVMLNPEQKPQSGMWRAIEAAAPTVRVQLTEAGVRNAAEMLDAPRVRTHEIEILSPDQVQAVLEAVRGQPLYPVAALGVGSGLRRGEVLGLRWQDVDLDAGHLRVEQALEETTRDGLAFKPPKTRHGRRTVTLPPSTVTLLRGHWKAQREQRLALGFGRAEPSSLVFADWDGSPRSPRALTQQWRKAMKKASLRVTFHSLRHTHASTLIAAGLDVLTISRRLGHGSPAITLGVYGHLFKPDDRAAAIMEKALSGAG